MTPVQEKLIILLNEIDGICKQHDLHYFLAQEAALSAYRSHHFESDAAYLSVFMTLPDALRFKNIINGGEIPDRYVDSVFDNDHFPDFTMKYCDENTLYINLDNNRGLKSYGLFIKILLLRLPFSGLSGKTSQYLQSGWIYNYEDYYSGNLQERNQKLKNISSGLLSVSRKSYHKSMLSLLERSQKKVSFEKELVFRTAKGKRYLFPKNLFLSTQLVEFENYRYPIPSDTDSFFKTMYDLRWENTKFKKKALTERTIVDPDMPYKFFFDYCKEHDISLNYHEVKMNEKKARHEVYASNKEINTAWKYVLRSGARFKMWDLYMPKKDLILQLHREENWDKLQELFTEYDEVTANFLSKNECVFFDQEIFDIYLDTLRHFGDTELAEKLAALVPPEHLAPIYPDRRNICVVGAGNIGLALACSLSLSEKNHVTVYSKTDFDVSGMVFQDKETGKEYTDLKFDVTGDPRAALEYSDYIFCTYPAFLRNKFINEVKDHILPGTKIGFVPGYGGAEYACSPLLEKNVTVFGLQRVPFVARQENKKVSSVISRKDKLFLASIPKHKTNALCREIEDLLGIPTVPLKEYLSITLAPSNPLLHLTGLYNVFKDYKPGMSYDRQLMFYEEWNDDASRLLFQYDEELQKICNSIQELDLEDVVSLKEYYESPTPEAMTRKLKSIKAFEVVKVPLVKENDKYYPDLNSRMFIEDFPFGIAIIKYFAVLTKVETPAIDTILQFYERLTGISYFQADGSLGKDYKNSGIPYNYGLETLEEIIDFYKQ